MLHTGQHYDSNMSDVFFTELGIPAPNYHLGIGSGRHGAQTGEMLAAIEEALLKEKPDWVMIYGDTNSTLAGAIAAAKLYTPVAHVEAGLRSFNRRMPEEVNRILADHVSSLLLAPTETAVENLAREGITGSKVINVGDVMYDAAIYFGDRAEQTSRVLDSLGLARSGYILATIHRAENTDDPVRLAAIFKALAEVGCDYPVVMPLHPRTKSALQAIGCSAEDVRLIDPQGYLDMVMLEKHAALVVTDSGGVQKEAFFHGVPCVTLRDETEWVELVDLGWNRLLPPSNAERLREGILAAIGSKGQVAQPYGDGDASGKIVDALVGFA
jgi:UDP-GlcNAc3NAcA epimerase